MLIKIEGVYRNGKIELIHLPDNMPDETQVIVTFLTSGSVDLNAHGIDEAQAADLRVRLQTFAEDWDDPQMDVYDNYDTAKSSL